MAKKRHRTAYQKHTAAIEKEGKKQCMLLYSATALALYRYWGKKKTTIVSLFDISGEAWEKCAEDTMHSMIELCDKETGIEIQNETGKSWKDLPYMNATLDVGKMSNAQMAYMRIRQKAWVAPQIMACMMVSLHRKYGFGFERLSRLYNQIDAIRTEYNLDPDKLREACREETHIDVHEVYTRPREGKVV
jgi:hypothetical protein